MIKSNYSFQGSVFSRRRRRREFQRASADPWPGKPAAWNTELDRHLCQIQQRRTTRNHDHRFLHQIYLIWLLFLSFSLSLFIYLSFFWWIRKNQCDLCLLPIISIVSFYNVFTFVWKKGNQSLTILILNFFALNLHILLLLVCLFLRSCLSIDKS